MAVVKGMNCVKDVDMTDETLLEDGPLVDFRGATLQIQQDIYQSRSPSSLGDDNDSVTRVALSPDFTSEMHHTAPDLNHRQSEECSKPAISGGADTVSPITAIPRKISETLRLSRMKSKDRPTSSTEVMCQNPIIAQDDAKDFFSYRDGLVENAVKECINNIISTDTDGELLGNWLLTEISLWDNEKERLILLTEHSLITVKYDFIALKQLDCRKVPLYVVDTLVIGDLIYPSGSLVPRLNGLATGVTTVVKGCVLKPLQERWARAPPGTQDAYTSAFDVTNFEPRSRNVRGLRAMWNRGVPLAFSKKWNPFNNQVPWTTYTSHPLFLHKEGESKPMYDVDDFARTMVMAVERCQQQDNDNSSAPCRVEHKPIILQNYVGLGSLIHNRNALGFFKVRGKFSF